MHFNNCLTKFQTKLLIILDVFNFFFRYFSNHLHQWYFKWDLTSWFFWPPTNIWIICFAAEQLGTALAGKADCRFPFLANWPHVENWKWFGKVEIWKVLLTLLTERFAALFQLGGRFWSSKSPSGKIFYEKPYGHFVEMLWPFAEPVSNCFKRYVQI